MIINNIVNTASTFLSYAANAPIVSAISSAAQSPLAQIAMGGVPLYFLARRPETNPKKQLSETDVLIQRLHSDIFFERNRLPYIAKAQDVLNAFPRIEDQKRLLEIELDFIEATRSYQWSSEQKTILLEKLTEILALSRSEEGIIADTLQLLKERHPAATPNEAIELLQIVADLPKAQRKSVIKYANEWIEKHRCGYAQDLAVLIETIAKIRADKKTDEMTELFLRKVDEFYEKNYEFLEGSPENNSLKIDFLQTLANIRSDLTDKTLQATNELIGQENYLFGKIKYPEHHIAILQFLSESEEICDDLTKLSQPYWLPDTKFKLLNQFVNLGKQEQIELAAFLLLLTRGGHSHDQLFELITEFSTLSAEQKERIVQQIERMTPSLPPGELFTLEEFLFFIENDKENLLEPLVDGVVEYFHAGNPMTREERAQLFSTYSVYMEES